MSKGWGRALAAARAQQRAGKPRASLPLPQCTAAEALIIDVPGQTWGPNGSHRHWSVAQRRRNQLHGATMMMLHTAISVTPPWLPRLVIMTRIGPRLMDTDNAALAMKGARDAVAQWLGVDDGSDAIDWIVRRARGPYAVRIELRSKAAT